MTISSFERSPQAYARLGGVLLCIAALICLVNSFALMVAPDLADSLFPDVLVPALVGELSLCLWLIIKGVNVREWEQRASRTASH